MNYYWLKKCLAVGIILLFVGTGFIPSIAQNIDKPSQLSSRGNWLYVGGNGPGNYTTIQDAIHASVNGDTVFVFHGAYNEKIMVNKSISLLGENKDTTVINGSGYTDAVYINETGITISGFTIQDEGASWIWRRGIFISSSSNNIEIHNNIITKNYIGIDIYDTATDILIYDNVIKNNNNGMYCSGDEYAFIEIYHNIFSDNEVGINGEHNFSIYENVISNNSVGIANSAGFLNFIHDNNIRDNKVGLQIVNFIEAQIYENNFINNGKHTSLARSGLFSDIQSVRVCKQNWSKNYWDDLITRTPRPIIGLTVLAIYLYFGIFNGFIFPVTIYPYVEYDEYPAEEPYDIPIGR
jgi:parallel beta-helix repeat protein